MKLKYLSLVLTIAGMAYLSPVWVKAQRMSNATNRAPLTANEKAFVQDAINKNNEAMALAQAALKQSQKKDVQLIAQQIMNDHRAAQKKLYAIANISDTVPYSRNNVQPIAGRLPLTDNLDTRRNRTVTSIINEDTKPVPTATNPNTASTNNPIAGTGSMQQSQRGFDTSSRFGVNQPFNNNTSIDNANGVNNSNRTDVGSYSGRASETNTPAYSQNPATGNQQLNNGINSNNSVIPPTVASGNTLPDFPSRVIDTVRQTGSTAGFQNPGTNLSFPGNERYSKTTPAVAPNNNAGSDYGVNGVVVNNAQTNALNTAPYNNNDINSNSVQTGRVLPTSDPTAVINSSTSSMRNKDVGYNNANTATNGTVQQSGQMAADNANGVNRRTSEVINGNNTNTRNSTTLNNPNVNNSAGNTSPANQNSGGILAGRTSGNRNTANGNTPIGTSGSLNNSFYSTPFADIQSVNSLRSTQADAFDSQWAIQMNTNQQTAASLYQSSIKKVTNPQVKAYINTVLPLLRGHQFALRQWQGKQ